MVSSLPSASDRDTLIGLLDAVRHDYESARHRRTELVLKAREAGFSFHEIGVYVGMTEGGARKLASRAVSDAA